MVGIEMLDDDKGHAAVGRDMAGNNRCRASTPPAEAPMPTMGQAGRRSRTAASGSLLKAVSASSIIMRVPARIVIPAHRPPRSRRASTSGVFVILVRALSHLVRQLASAR